MRIGNMLFTEQNRTEQNRTVDNCAFFASCGCGALETDIIFVMDNRRILTG